MPPKQPPRAPLAPPPLSANEAWDNHIDAVLSELQRIYFESIRPVETKFEYDVFRPSWFSETIVQKKPFVTFLGPFSAGKSTFINYLLQNNLLLTGPQPVTDKFTVIMHGDEFQQIPGRVLMADSSQPFRGLNEFGEYFAEVFHGLLLPHPILRSVSLIDTPGVLEAAGDMHKRRYDYIKVCRWFVEKSDLVFFLFDPTKLDAGTELRMLFKHALRGQESKIRIILNKADMVGPQELMRVYGALFWNLSGLISTTEPPRVYMSSFWDQPYRKGTDHAFFNDEKSDLLYDLIETVPIQSLDKRVTSVLQRATRVITFALVCATYKSRMPLLFGKDKARDEFMVQYTKICEDLANKHRLSVTDFPPLEEVLPFLQKVHIDKFYDMDRMQKKGWIEMLKQTIDHDIPMLLRPIKQSEVVDPRDRKHAIMLQREYANQMSIQLSGQQPQQSSAYRSQATSNVPLLNPAVNQTQQALAREQSTLLQQCNDSRSDQMSMMMQMMQGLMQQQGQQLQGQDAVVPQLSQEQAAMMMQLMGQMQVNPH